ncbi:transcription factor jun-D-like isoform X2 [Passer montanus]|uniref:transcription factor jun-D-like isoform X2 n=1 Tax=Passer montanus TaxID=9160 RepID=UPI00195FCA4B|nr:transcription factor jun-D-like isoform X2 [Passer montanus]XP_039586263.1 transcription factor jun-D-like isoform X2 [Passer montanus]
MEAILEERITNCGISAAGRRRGALPTQVERRQDRSEEREAGASREGRRAPGAHPDRGVTSTGAGASGGGGGGAETEMGERWGRGQLPGHGGDRARLGGSSRVRARLGQGSAWGQLLQAAGGAAPAPPPPPRPPPPAPAIQRAAAAIPTGPAPRPAPLSLGPRHGRAAETPERGSGFWERPCGQERLRERGWAEIPLLITRVPLLPRRLRNACGI